MTKGSLVSGTRPAARRTVTSSPVNGVVVGAGLMFPLIGGLGLMSNRASDVVANGSAQLVEGEVPAVSTMVVRGAAQRKAAVICRHCPVITECGADALDNRVEFGVWGGMTERQRRALLKQHPEVVSWAEFFAAQRKHRSAV
jgi:WhiB family transcriptional regulator, redox-sensing transcriptional regulator